MSGVSMSFDGSAIADFLDQKAERILEAVAQQVVKQAKDNVDRDLNNYGVATGNLRDSIKYKMRGSGFGAVARVGTTVVYGRIHEFGGTIEASGAAGGDGVYLVFQTADGNWVKTPSVNMPPRPWLRPAVLEARGKMQVAANTVG